MSTGPFNYTPWLDEVEQKAIIVNQRRFASITSRTPKTIKVAAVKESYAYLRLFMRFVSLNRQVLFTVRAQQGDNS